MAKQLFLVHRAIVTSNAVVALMDAGQSATEFLDQHVHGDWGDLCDEDKQSNELALKNGGRLLSVYRLRTGSKIWIITEWDRSVTTVLLPEDY